MSTDPRPATSRAGTQPGGGWTPPTVEHLQSLLPQYEITAMLGHGGMGAVYKGRQKSLDRVVAIKILPPGLENSDAKFVERFQNEARTMARLMHPGIVAVFDFGETEEGQLYFVMEYVDGTDVAKMIQSSGKLPQDYALAITAHVCDALAYAHANGVVHRDIKPANILINMQGQIKVADFGLAKADDPSQTSGLTKTGYAMGTPDYVSPEALIMGSSIDGRADLYAVGVMLYQMLTGEIPRGLFQMPNVRTKGETDPRFDAIISKAMQTDREARYQSAAELRRELDVILSTPHIKQDASRAVAAVPLQAVAETPGKRSAVAVKPGAKGPKPPQQAPQNQKVEIGNTKSNTGLWLGIAAAAVVVIGGAVFMLSGGKPDVARPSKVENSASPGSTVESRPTPPKPKPAPAALTPAPKPATIAPTNSDGWIDGLAEWLAVPGNAAKGTLKQEGAVWRWVGPEAVFLGTNPPAKSLANVVVRLTFKHGGRSTVGIKLRIGKTANYNAVIRPDGVAEIKLMKDLQEAVLAKFDPIPGFDPRVSHVMEFRAQGDVLTLLVDGQTRGSVKDATLVTGSFAVVYGLIEKIEYRDLNGSAPPPRGGDTPVAAPKTTPVSEGKKSAAAPADPKLAALLVHYTKYIESGLAAAVAADKPAFEAELARLKASAPLPSEDDVKLPAEFKRLRGILRAQMGSQTAAPAAVAMSTDKAQSLFNGSTLAGWLVGGDPASFKVEDGCLKAAGPKGNLIYAGSGAAPAWTDFDLTMKVKTGSLANSGVWIHCPVQATGANAVALEVQIANDPSPQMTGSIFGIAPITKPTVSNDQWFDLRVVVRGMTITVYVDGEKINEWTQPTDWTPPIKVPQARLISGSIGFQGYGGEIWIKDVKITVP